MAIPYFPNTNFWSGWAAPFFITLSLLVAFYIVHHDMKRKGMNYEIFYRGTFWMMMGALAGGRIAYFFTPGPFFLDIWRGGFHSYGVLIGGFLGITLYGFSKKKEIRKRYKTITRYGGIYLDIWVIGIVIAVFFYRIGCFLSRCIERGTETDVFWGVIDYGVVRHPITLYYSIAGIIIFIILMQIKQTKIARDMPGYIVTWFAILYPLSRVFLDFFRVYEIRYSGLSFSQWVYLVIAVVSIIDLFSRHYLYKKNIKDKWYSLELIKYLLKKI